MTRFGKHIALAIFVTDLIIRPEMKKLFIVILFVISSSVLFGQSKKGYEININIAGLQDSTIFIAYHLGDKQYIKDTVKLNKAGHGVASGNETLPQGIYMVVLPGNRYFEFLVSGNQHFALSCSYDNYFSTLKFTGSEENSAFIDYQKKWLALQQQAISIAKRIQDHKSNPDSMRILTSAQRSQEESMKSFLKGVIKANNNNLLATLVKALLPMEVPDFKVPADARNPDSVRWVWNYNYNKDHFFDNIDLTDERLLRTPILHSRLKAFFTNVVIQMPDSINKEIDKIVKITSKNYRVFQFVSVYLFNHFRESEIMGHDAVMVKLADDIYLSGKADWVTKEFKDDLKKQIDLIRPNLIGKKAENLVMDSYKGIFVSLYDIEKEFTIIYFWEPDCGHCKESTPKLLSYYKTAKDNDIEIFAVCTTSDKAQWKKYIEDNQITWINGWDPERRSNFDFYYNVQSTPMLYILDRNKKIIAKKLSADDIGNFLENYKRFN
jgi:thiol-disulfide isomerase/thioredoxin